MDFSSDTSAPAHPKVLEAMVTANSGQAGSYGGDEYFARVRSALENVLETKDFDYWMCASGTAANALALSLICSPVGSILCAEEAHIERDERGAPEFFTGGGKLHLLQQENGRIEENALRSAIASIDRSFVHETPAEVLSLTNLTECGTAYSPEQVQHYCALAQSAGLATHLDGARLANAVAYLGCRPADLSWKAGVDILTLGLTKTGAIGCEIIVLFGEKRSKYQELLARAKRSGHMPPKMRYLAAQSLALFEDNLWIDLASRANATAKDLANRLCAIPGTRLMYPVNGNEVFAHLSEESLRILEKASTKFYPWPGGAHRFVCSWNTQNSELEGITNTLL